MLVMMTSPMVFSTTEYRQKQKKKNSYIWLHTNSYGWMTR